MAFGTMVFVRLFGLAAFSIVFLASAQDECDRIGPAVIKGKKFFDSRSGKYIPLKGVNYYPRPNAGELSTGNNRDFFSEESRSIWSRDVEHFKALGINVIRIFAVNPGLDHSGFMCALQEAGIYVIVGLAANCENCAITGMAAPDCYPGALKERGQFVINVMAKYENVLAFSAGNEAHLYAPGQPPEHNAPCQKQFIRDMRAYIDSCPNLRKIPVGVAVADFDRDSKALYYNCRSDPSDEYENAEWYGLNIYQHCNPNDVDIDGFQSLLESHRNYSMSIPVVLSEFGCMNSRFPTIDGFEGQRDFRQVDMLHSPEFRDYFAGALAFEYSSEKSFVEDKTPYNVTYPFREYSRYNFGLGYYAPETCDDVDIPCSYTPYPEFDTLATRYAAVESSGVPDFDSYEPGTLQLTSCPLNFPALNSFTWESELVNDLDCVGPNYVFICPNTAPECLPPFAAPQTPPPTTTAPSTTPSTKPALQQESSVPTALPSKEGTIAPTILPSDSPILDASEKVSPSPSLLDQTLAPAPSVDTTPSPLFIQPVEFVPTSDILAEDSSSSPAATVISPWLLLCLALVAILTARDE